MVSNIIKRSTYIFTSYLAVSHIFLSHKSSRVTLLGSYGDVLDGDKRRISIKTDFATLNDLLTEAGPNAEETIQQICNLLSEPTEHDAVLHTCDDGALSFSDHIFALMIVHYTDEQNNFKEEEEDEYSYKLNAYTKMENIAFSEYCRAIHTQSSEDYYSLLAMQYHIYINSRKRVGDRQALYYANLTDPLFFTLAKFHYDEIEALSVDKRGCQS
jgi:hypothetical protein